MKLSALRLKPLDIRRRLTLQTVGLLVLICAGFAAFSAACYYSLVRVEFDENLERVWASKATYFVADPVRGARYAPPAKVNAKDSNFRPTFYELWSPSGELLYRSDSFRGLPSEDVFGPPDLALIDISRGTLATVDVENSGTFRVKSSPLRIGGRDYLFRAARESSEIRERVSGLAQTFANLLLVFCVIAFFAADWLIKRTLAPVEAVRQHAQSISVRKLHERLPVVNPNDEIGQLSLTLNHLLNRLEGSFEEMKNFTADASHELRTPLAAIRALGESTLCRTDLSNDELRESLRDILEETQRLTGLTERLLTMARLDARTADARASETFDLSSETRRVVEHLEVLASEKNQRIEVDLPPSLHVRGDATLVLQALTNLVDNAIKYTPENGSIRIHGATDGDSARISVTDTGPGIATEHQSLIFGRFYRVDSDRGRGSGGYGVGLAIAKKALELSEGTMELQSTPGLGSRFTMKLRSAEISSA